MSGVSAVASNTTNVNLRYGCNHQVKAWEVYTLLCEYGALYVGITSIGVDNRLQQHLGGVGRGGAKYTTRYRPIAVVKVDSINLCKCEAEIVENNTARGLRKKGFYVGGGYIEEQTEPVTGNTHGHIKSVYSNREESEKALYKSMTVWREDYYSRSLHVIGSPKKEYEKWKRREAKRVRRLERKAVKRAEEAEYVSVQYQAEVDEHGRLWEEERAKPKQVLQHNVHEEERETDIFSNLFDSIVATVVGAVLVLGLVVLIGGSSIF